MREKRCPPSAMKIWVSRHAAEIIEPLALTLSHTSHRITQTSHNQSTIAAVFHSFEVPPSRQNIIIPASPPQQFSAKASPECRTRSRAKSNGSTRPRASASSRPATAPRTSSSTSAPSRSRDSRRWPRTRPSSSRSRMDRRDRPPSTSPRPRPRKVARHQAATGW